MSKKLFITFLLVLFQVIGYSQQIKLEGKVTDSLSNPLAYANIIARPQDQKVTMAFAIADEQGHYELGLKSNTTYNLTVSYTGFKPNKYTVDGLSEDKILDFVLKESSEQLDEVVIDYQMPISVKGDTTTYRPKAFVTGEERKLKEVLNKLPGVEVDKEGLVTVQGKRVTKMLVEDKEFFDGDSKLAVENIPADAVKDVQVIDNYNNIGFMKGLMDTDDMAMNIKLKKDKKRFMFGDLTAGLGNTEHYLGQANIFYYAPKTNLNYIGNLNDVGYKPFTFKDYMRFQGGINKISKNKKSFFRVSQSDFADFFDNPDFQSNSSKFSAVNWQQTIHPKLDFMMYGLFSDNLAQTKTINSNQYLNDNIVYLIENRVNNQQDDKSYGMGKLSLEYTPNPNTSLTYNVFSKISQLKNIDNTHTSSILQELNIEQENKAEASVIRQDFEWHQKISRKHTTSLALNYDYSKNQPNSQWLTNQPILQGLLPIIDSDSYRIFQDKSNDIHQVSGLFKHYWVINNLNHIYTSIGNQYSSQLFKSSSYQLLNDFMINDFYDAGFGNDNRLKINDFYLGLEYKFKKNKTTFKLGLFEHLYNWQIVQETINKNHKAVLLPELKIEHELKKSEKLYLTYSMNTSFSDASQYANRLSLINFNSVFKGNLSLENELSHLAGIRYYKFNMIKDIFINTHLNYTYKVSDIRNEYRLQGIDQYLVPVMTSDPKTNWTYNLQIRKGISDFYIKAKSNILLSTYKQSINEVVVNTQSFLQKYDLTLGTNFEKYPNFDLGFEKMISQYTSGEKRSKFITNKPYAELSYDFLNGFILKADYQKTFFINDNQSTTAYDSANASLFYQKEDSPFGFELNSTNLFNISNKESSSFNSFMITQNQTFIMARIVMFKLSYKL